MGIISKNGKPKGPAVGAVRRYCKDCGEYEWVTITENDLWEIWMFSCGRTKRYKVR